MSVPSQLQSYRHHKGHAVTLLYVAENSLARSELMAVYFSHERRKVLVQPLVRFLEPVRWPDGHWRRRHVPLGEEESSP